MSEPVFFWGGIYSQWYQSPFLVDVIRYPTAEHYMMAEKARLFDDAEALDKIFSTDDPSVAKFVGRHVKGWDDAKWAAVRFQVVCRASYEKFRQNPKLGAQLVATGDREIVEASPSDKIWGIGMGERDAQLYWQKESLRSDIPFVTYPGLNLLGEALMVARQMLAPR